MSHERKAGHKNSKKNRPDEDTVDSQGTSWGQETVDASDHLVIPGGSGSPEKPGSNSSGEGPGSVVGRYKLQEKLGEGGFGEVFRAEQTEPVRRSVALKIIKLGMDTRQVVARFEAERQALALMDHPHIAKVLDGGATEAGRPFFVMELVNGLPITEFCDANNLPVAQRLELFITVCQAVQHAHQKGIIHRDIKPTNILVAHKDETFVPKVIDFGVAKATEQELTERTLFTEFGQFVGTPAYMSPEQAERGVVDVDTRSDIYSLGVVLYEMLTGTPPFDPKSLRQAGYEELQRIIREEEPPRPSTRLSTMGRRLEKVAKLRSVDPARLSKSIRGELDWIIMKSLDKDRSRRYETANGLAADVKRFLNQEAVTAGPPSARYRVSKLVRRNRGAVAAALAIVAALMLGVAGTTMGLVRSTRANAELNRALQNLSTESDRVRAERDRAVEAEALAAAEAVKAKRQADIAEGINRFLNDDLLASVAPDHMGTDVTVKEATDAAAASLDGAFEDQPLVEAAIRMTVGMTYSKLGNYELAQRHFERARDIRDRELPEGADERLQSQIRLAGIYADTEKLAEADAIYEEVIAAGLKHHGPEHRSVLTSKNDRAILFHNMGRHEEAEALFLGVLDDERKTLGNEHPDTLSTINNLALLYDSMGRQAEALDHLQQLVATHQRINGQRHTQTLLAKANLGYLLLQLGRFEEADALLREVIEEREKIFGKANYFTANAMATLAATHLQRHQPDQALELLQIVVPILKEVLGPNNQETLKAMNNLAVSFANLDRNEEALPIRLEVLERQRKTFGPEHPDTLTSANNLATLYMFTGRLDEAEALYRETLAVDRRVLGDDHPDTIITHENLGGVLFRQGRYEEVATIVNDVLAARERVLGADHPAVSRTLYNLGKVKTRLGQTDEGIALILRALKRYINEFGRDSEPVAQAYDALSQAYLKAQTFDKAVKFAKRCQKVMEAVHGHEHPKSAGALHDLGSTQHAAGDFEAAIASFSEAVDVRRRLLGETNRWTCLSMVGLAESLTHLQRFEEAESAGKTAYEALAGQFSDSHEDVQKAVNVMIDLYTAWAEDQPSGDTTAKLATWKTRLALDQQH